MLKELHISNLAVIEDTTLEFNSNYTALVGETGAGKSLIINSLSLLMGEKADFSLLRNKEKKANITALFSLDNKYIFNHEEVKEYVEDNTLIIKRVLNPDKTSRYYLNDEVVTLTEYKKVTSHLIDIHSQNGKNDLLDDSKQINYVDKYNVEIASIKEEYIIAYHELNASKNKLHELINNNKELDEEYLKFQIEEIEKYDLKENEIETLNEEYNNFKEGEKLKNKYDSYLLLNNDNSSLNDKINEAIKVMHGFIETSLNEEASQVLITLNTLVDELYEFEKAYKKNSIDQKRVDEINERLFTLKSLQRKYGKSSAEILSKYNDYKQKLAYLNDFEFYKKEIQNEIDKKEKKLKVIAEKLTNIRKETCIKLASSINNEMKDLGLLSNSFMIDISDDNYSINGKDKIIFKVKLNKGIAEESLSKAASGGESSRLMLALKVVLNNVDPYDILVFDEIDTGISGKIASLVAKKIQKISKDTTIILISHLAQVVASCSDAILIKKSNSQEVTTTTTKTLSKDELIMNIASIISSEKVTDAALNQAKSLYDEYH